MKTAALFFVLSAVLQTLPAQAREDGFCAPYGSYSPYFNARIQKFGPEDPDYEFRLSIDCDCEPEVSDSAFQLRCERDDAGAVCAWHDLGHPNCADGLATYEIRKEPNSLYDNRGTVLFDIDEALETGMRIALPSGRDVSFSMSHRDFGPLREDILGLTFKRDGQIELETPIPSGHVYDTRRPGCVSGDSIASGWLALSYPKDLAAEIVSFALGRGWEAYGTDFEAGPTPGAVVGLLTCEYKDPETGLCYGQLRVGPGMELAAITDLNALDDQICAAWHGVGKGGLFGLRVAELPLYSLLDPANPDPAALAMRLHQILTDAVFDEGVDIAPVVPVRIGNDFATRLRAPGPRLGVDASEGYWYDIDLAISVGLTLGENGLSEELDISTLDVIEVRAPETLETLPPGLLRSGRSVTMYSERKFEEVLGPDGDVEIILPDIFGLALNEDGQRFARWQQVVGARIAEALGGQVLGGE